MHPLIYKEFERICSERQAGGAVLEVGAIPSDKSLLTMQSLQNHVEKIGINLTGPYEYRDFKIVKGNANAMTDFEDNRFDTVLCNAMLEHDKFFWKTIAEIRRVTKPGGLVVIGTPGYVQYHSEKIRTSLRKIPGFKRFLYRHLDLLNSATITFEIHGQPGDYYRFSPQTFQEVFFDGFKDVEITSVMAPPRIIGSGIKP